MRKNLIYTIVTLIVICLVFGGCGGKSPQPNDSKTTEGRVEETIDVESGNILDGMIEVETTTPDETETSGEITETDVVIEEPENPIFSELDKKYQDIKPEDLPEIEYIEITPEEAFEIKESEVYDISGKLIKLWEVKDDVAAQGHWFGGIFEYEEGFYFDWSTMYMGDVPKGYIGKVNLENGIREYCFYSKKDIVSPVKVIFEGLFVPEYKRNTYLLVDPFKLYINSYLYDLACNDYITVFEFDNETKRYKVKDYKELQECDLLGCSSQYPVKYNPENNSLLTFDKSDGCSGVTDRGGIYLYDLSEFKTVYRKAFDYPPYEIAGYKLEDDKIKIYKINYTEDYWKFFSKGYYGEFGNYEKSMIKPWYYDGFWFQTEMMYGELTVHDKKLNYHFDIKSSGYNGKWLIKDGNVIHLNKGHDTIENVTISSYDLYTGNENWNFTSFSVKDILLLEDSILALVLNKESGGFDFLEIDYETGTSKVTYKNAFFKNPEREFFWKYYYKNKGFEVFDDKIIVDDRICYAEKSKYPGVIIPDQAVVFSVVDIPDTEDEGGWASFELSGYLEEDTFTILNNTKETKTFEISNIDERLEISAVSFTLDPDETKEIVVKQTALEHGKSPNIQITDMKDLVITWDDGEKILPVRFPEAPYNPGD